MKIAPGVSWHPFDDKIYVHNVTTQRDYILAGIALDILNFFKEQGDSTLEALCTRLSKEYEIDEIELQSDIRDFVAEMKSEKILYEGTNFYSEEPWSNKIPTEVSQIFAAKHKLFSIGLELTWRCVEKCIHCYIDDGSEFCVQDELSFDEYIDILRQARALGCINILFTGGEVLLRPDLCDIVDEAIRLGFIVNIYTTGVGLTDEIFDRLCAAKINSISVSLYSGIAEEHDRITRLKGSFEKTLKAVLMFKAAGVNTFIKCVAMKQNFNSLESLYKLGKRLNLYVSVSPRIISGHAGKCSKHYSLSNLELYKKFYLLQSQYIPADMTIEKHSREQLLDRAACYAGLSSFSIDPFGGVHACITFRETFGSVREDNLRTIWERARNLKLKNHLMREITPLCKNCKYLEYCTVCVADLINKNHGDFDNCSETLLEAKAAAEVFGR